MSNYPDDVTELPHEFDEEREFIFEVGGEIVVSAYSEEGAEIGLMETLKLYKGGNNEIN